MNSFCKKTTSLFILLFAVLNNSLHAMKINGNILNNVANPGQSISIRFEEKDKMVLLEMSDESLNTKVANIDNVFNLNSVFHQVMHNSSGGINTRYCNICRCDTMINNEISLVGKGYMDIRAKNFIQCYKSILKSPLISMTSNEVDFTDTFLAETQTLNFILEYPGSNYRLIQILFHEQPKNPTIIAGSINLKAKGTTQTLILSNVKEINVGLDEQAWNKALIDKTNEEAWNDNNFYNHINEYQSIYLASSFIFLFSLLLTYKNMS